jgi:hypothetical protein
MFVVLRYFWRSYWDRFFLFSIPSEDICIFAFILRLDGRVKPKHVPDRYKKFNFLRNYTKFIII